MLEDDVDTFLPGELASNAFEALGFVIDNVICAECLGFVGFCVVTDSGYDRTAKRLRHLDCSRADARPAGVNQDSLSGFEHGVSNNMCSTVAKCDRRKSGITQRNAFRHRNYEREVKLISSRAKPSM